jgi:hypothetical protein
MTPSSRCLKRRDRAGPRHPLEDAAKAHRLAAAGGVQAKIVLTL